MALCCGDDPAERVQICIHIFDYEARCHLFDFLSGQQAHGEIPMLPVNPVVNLFFLQSLQSNEEYRIILHVKPPTRHIMEPYKVPVSVSWDIVLHKNED